MCSGCAGAVGCQVRAERREVWERGVRDSAGEPGRARDAGRRHGAPVGSWAGGRERVGLGFRGSLCAEKPQPRIVYRFPLRSMGMTSPVRLSTSPPPFPQQAVVANIGHA